MKIQATTPSRVSLFGGGTDLPVYASKYGGVVISMAINLKQHITMYSDDDMFEVKGKSSFPLGADPNFYYKILDEFGINDGVHFTKLKSTYDGLIESGLGSSASAAVALVGAINKRLSLGLNLFDIAEKAYELEVNKLGLYGGKQDQYAATFGGVNVIEFTDKVNIIPLAKGFLEPLLPSMVLLYTGNNRESTTIQEGFKDLTISQVEALNNIKQLAVEAIDPIAKGDVQKVGYLLDQSWVLKRQSNKNVTNSLIDDLYRKALANGAYGGKICGSGGGGFMLFIVEPKNRAEFVKKMGLEEWDFDISWDGLQVRRLPE